MKRDDLLLCDDVEVETYQTGEMSFKGKEPLLWFTLPGPPKTWRVSFFDDELLEQLNGAPCFALTLSDVAHILIAESLMARKNRETLQLIFCHELLHAGLGTNGNDFAVKHAFGARTDNIAARREEAIAGLWSNGIAHSLFAARVMRLPKLPKMRK